MQRYRPGICTAIVVTFWLAFTMGYYNSKHDREKLSKGNVNGSSTGNGVVTKDYSKMQDGLIFSDSVSLGISGGDSNKELHYLYCQRALNEENVDGLELLMLHGAAFTAETWKSSGILNKLCAAVPKSSIRSLTALDLEVSADGKELEHVFDKLVEAKVLSGERVVLISPSASGKAVVSLADLAFHNSNKVIEEGTSTSSSQFLTQMIKGDF